MRKKDFRKESSSLGKGFKEDNSSKEKKLPPPLHLILIPHQMALVLAPTCTVGNEYLRMRKENENEDLRKKSSFSGKGFKEEKT